jgi:hypothetical protein
MFIPKIKLSRLHHEEFFNYFTEFKELVAKHYIGYDILSGEYPKLLALYGDLDNVLEQVQKSILTADLVDTDHLREMIFCGFRDSAKAMQFHFEEDKRRAANTLMLVFDTYGDVARRSYAEETAAIYNLVQDMKAKYVNELNTLGLTNWVAKLDDVNNRFKSQMNERDKERSLKPTARAVDVRREMEVCYGKVIRCIEATMILNPNHSLTPFVNELLAKIDRYKNVIAVRDGRKNNKEKSE